jgi:hypothetical protein
MKYSKYFGAKRRGFIKSISVLAPKGTIHLLNENIRYDNCSIHSKFVFSFNHNLQYFFNYDDFLWGQN